MRPFCSFVAEKRGYALFLIVYTAAFFLFVKLLGYLLPFLLGAVLAVLLLPICKLLENRFHAARKRAALFSVAAGYAVLLTIGGFLVFWLAHELIVLASGGGYFQYDELAPELRRRIESFLADLPQLAERLQQTFPGNFSNLMPAITGALRLLLSIPALLLSLALVPVSAFLFLSKREMLPAAGAALFGKSKTARLQNSLREMSKTSNGFAFSYTLLYTITFCESYIILFLLRMPYPIATAAAVTISDVFPVLGPGAVLLTLCAYRLLCGSITQAIGLFAGWVLVSVIRQVIEPRLISKITRTPASAMLAAVYASLISRCFWLIPYTALLFFLLPILRDTGILQTKKADA